MAMLLRFAASCDVSGARNSECKAYLGAVVVWLHAGKAKDAWLTYQVGAVRGLAGLGRLGRLCVLPACVSRTGIRAAQAGTNRGSRCRCRRTPWGSTTSAAATRRLRQMRCLMHIAGKRRQLGLVGR